MNYLIKRLSLFSLILFCSCQSSECYEIVEIERVEYNIKDLTIDQSTKDAEDFKPVEKDQKATDRHYVGQDFSLYMNTRAYEVIDLKSKRRFVKYIEDDDLFEEKEKYKKRLEISGMTLPVETGQTKLINGINCTEYILKSDYRPDVFYYIDKTEAFVYRYRNPFDFPGLVMRGPLYKGSNYVEEMTYEKRSCNCPQEYFDLINEVKSSL